jgi:uncharacterized membrane protein YgcG
MKNYLFILFVTLFFSSTAMADMGPPRPPKPSSILLAAISVPTRTGYVTDLSGKLSSNDRKIINQRLNDYHKSSGKTIAVALLPNLGGESVEDVGYQIANGWGIGKKDADNGVLLLVSFAERKSRIEVGRGLEGDLTDSKSSMILRNTLAPHFKRGDVYGGITAAVEEIALSISPGKGLPQVEYRTVPKPVAPVSQHYNNEPTTEQQSNDVGSVFFVFGLIAAIVAFFIWVVRKLYNAAQDKTRYDIMRREIQISSQPIPPIRAPKTPINNSYHPKPLVSRQSVPPAPSVRITPIPSSNVEEDLVTSSAAMTIPRTPIAKASVRPPVDNDTIEKVNRTKRLMEESNHRAEEANRIAREKIRAGERRIEEENRRRDEDRRRREEEDRRRREQEEEDNRRRSSFSLSSYGSNDSSGWGSSSSSSSSSSGGFDGGSFGGGGSSGDW